MRVLTALQAGIERLAERPSGPDPMGVIVQALGTASTAQTDMLSTLGELAMRGAARRMGIRGGTKRALTAERRADGTFERAQTKRLTHGCALCADPYRQSVTIEMIAAHRAHGGTNGDPHRQSDAVTTQG